MKWQFVGKGAILICCLSMGSIQCDWLINKRAWDFICTGRANKYMDQKDIILYAYRKVSLTAIVQFWRLCMLCKLRCVCVCVSIDHMQFCYGCNFHHCMRSISRFMVAHLFSYARWCVLHVRIAIFQILLSLSLVSDGKPAECVPCLLSNGCLFTLTPFNKFNWYSNKFLFCSPINFSIFTSTHNNPAHHHSPVARCFHIFQRPVVVWWTIACACIASVCLLDSNFSI